MTVGKDARHRLLRQTVDAMLDTEEDPKISRRGRSSLGEGWPWSLKGVRPRKLKTSWAPGSF